MFELWLPAVALAPCTGGLVILGSNPLCELLSFSSCLFMGGELGDGGKSSTGQPNRICVTEETAHVCACLFCRCRVGGQLKPFNKGSIPRSHQAILSHQKVQGDCWHCLCCCDLLVKTDGKGTWAQMNTQWTCALDFSRETCGAYSVMAGTDATKGLHSKWTHAFRWLTSITVDGNTAVGRVLWCNIWDTCRE